jgi:hypothetical protein
LLLAFTPRAPSILHDVAPTKAKVTMMDSTPSTNLAGGGAFQRQRQRIGGEFPYRDDPVSQEKGLEKRRRNFEN